MYIHFGLRTSATWRSRHVKSSNTQRILITSVNFPLVYRQINVFRYWLSTLYAINSGRIYTINAAHQRNFYGFSKHDFYKDIRKKYFDFRLRASIKEISDFKFQDAIGWLSTSWEIKLYTLILNQCLKLALSFFERHLKRLKLTITACKTA